MRVRLPRVAAAALVGAALAGAGTAYQTLFRNPLVSPDILGVSSGAGFGAVLGILLSLPVVGIQALAFLLGLGTVALVYLIAAALHGHDRTLVLVLSGVVVGALAGACISLVKILADPYDQLPAITFWLLGSLAGVKLADLAIVAPLVIVGLVPLILLRWRIGVLSLGDDEARALGVDVPRLRMLVIARRHADDRERRGDLRRDRLDRPDDPAHRPHAGRAELRPPAAGRDAARRLVHAAGRHAGALASRASRRRSAF